MKANVRPVVSFSLALLLAVPSLAATRPSGGGGNVNNGAVRSSSRSSVNQTGSARNANANQNANVNRNTNVNQNANVNRNTNVNQNTNVNVNRNVDVNVNSGYHNNYYGGGGCCYHPVAAAAAVATTAAVTAAVVGSMVNTLPTNCHAIVANGVTYQQCGSAYYKPQFSGGSTSYVVVNPP